MFLGEFSCMALYYIIIAIYRRRSSDMVDMKANLPSSVAGSNNFNPFIFFPPAMCDMLGTSTMYIGLNMTYASSFQMLRGMLISKILIFYVFLKNIYDFSVGGE